MCPLVYGTHTRCREAIYDTGASPALCLTYMAPHTGASPAWCLPHTGTSPAWHLTPVPHQAWKVLLLSDYSLQIAKVSTALGISSSQVTEAMSISLQNHYTEYN